MAFFVLSNSVFGATIYVSNTAPNGYSIGNDSNTYVQSQNKATPKLTLTGAESDWSENFATGNCRTSGGDG